VIPGATGACRAEAADDGFSPGRAPQDKVGVSAALGSGGTLARNTFRGPDVAQTNVSPGRQFRIAERFFSRLHLNNPNTGLNNVNCGKSLDQASPRVIQAGLRVTF
jgi:hypothetical protein